MYRDIEMNYLECVFCSTKTWVFIKSEQDIKNLKCIECNSTIYAIENEEYIDRWIEYIKGEQI